MIVKSNKYINKHIDAVKIIVIIIIMQFSLFAQQYNLKQLRIEDGLSQSTIFSSLQDKKGYMWFATRSGLNRYDGYKFNVYYNDPKNPATLSDDGTNSLFEDKAGTLWIGTIYGNINKYNRNSETFEYKNLGTLIKSIPDQVDDFYEYPLSFSRNQSTTITSITQDNDGLLWIGTWGKGIICIDKNFNLKHHIYSNNQNNNGLKSNRIMDLQFDDYGKLWAATFGGGLTRITKSSNTKKENIFLFETINKGDNKFSLTDDKLLTLFMDSQKNIWIGSYYGGVIFISGKDKDKPLGKLKINSERCPLASSSDVRNTIMSIVEDHQNYIWIGTFGGGLIRYDLSQNKSLHFFNNPLDHNSLGDNDVLSLSVDRSGIIWAGSHLGAGVTKIQINNSKFHLIKHDAANNNSLNDNVVWSVYKDLENILWIGTYKGGLNKIDLNKNTFASISKSDNKNGISSNHIRVIREDNYNNLWIGTYDGGLNIVNKNNFRSVVYKNNPADKNSISANQVQDVLFESDSIYWVATFGGGLNKIVVKGNPLNQKLFFKHYKNELNNSESISDNRVYKLFRSKDGSFWIATYGGGLNKFDPLTEKFKRYSINSGKDDKFNVENLMTVFEDSDGTIWLGSYGGSLTSFDRKTEKFKRYSWQEGLTSGVVYGILEDNDKNLWISSDDGIFKLNLTTKQFTRYDIQDGVQSLEFSGGAYFKDENGIMYFGGINGLNFFDPKEIVTNKFLPSIVITSVKVFNNPIKGERKEITLDYKQNFITFEFSSLDFYDPLDNQYAFLLEGMQSNWQYVDASSRIATFTNLSPGTYIFKVKGSNSDGIWSDKYASIKIIIIGPFYKTWWFVSFVIVIISLLLYYLSTLRIKNQLAIEKLKSKLAADLHDNIGSGLTEISILSEVASSKIKSNNNSGNELGKISDISRQLVDNMSDIVWVVNPKRDSLHDLILRLKDSYSDLLGSLGIFLRTKDLEKLADVKLPMDFKQNLYLIFKEAINNSVKHSNCKELVLQANLRNDILEISLTDNGNGFDENNKAKGNGLKNMENRAKLIGGKIKIKSSKNLGTSIRFIGKVNRLSKLNFLLNK